MRQRKKVAAKISKTKCLIFVVLSVFSLCQLVKAQKNKSASLKIIESRPSVYITFDHRGKQEPLFEGETNERIWLRLNNNTKLKLFLCEFSVDKEYGDRGLFYKVERFSFFQEYENVKIPDGYGKIDTCDVFTLRSGKSILFSLPKEHLSKGLSIKTQFYYGWTGNWKEDIYEGTTHFVAFGSDELKSE